VPRFDSSFVLTRRASSRQDYDRVAEELRSRYTVGYVSRSAGRDAKWRRIVVRTPAHEDLKIRHTLGDYAARK